MTAARLAAAAERARRAERGGGGGGFAQRGRVSRHSLYWTTLYKLSELDIVYTVTAECQKWQHFLLVLILIIKGDLEMSLLEK